MSRHLGRRPGIHELNNLSRYMACSCQAQPVFLAQPAPPIQRASTAVIARRTTLHQPMIGIRQRRHANARASVGNFYATCLCA